MSAERERKAEKHRVRCDTLNSSSALMFPPAVTTQRMPRQFQMQTSANSPGTPYRTKTKQKYSKLCYKESWEPFSSPRRGRIGVMQGHALPGPESSSRSRAGLVYS